MAIADNTARLEDLRGAVNALPAQHDLSGVTAAAEDVLVGKTIINSAGELTEGSCTFDADTSDGDAEAGEILAGRIAYAGGVRIVGTLVPDVPQFEEKSVTPAAEVQQILPGEGFDGLSRVTVLAIPVSEAANAAGGITVTIGG